MKPAMELGARLVLFLLSYWAVGMGLLSRTASQLITFEVLVPFSIPVLTIFLVLSAARFAGTQWCFRKPVLATDKAVLICVLFLFMTGTGAWKTSNPKKWHGSGLPPIVDPVTVTKLYWKAIT